MKKKNPYFLKFTNLKNFENFLQLKLRIMRKKLLINKVRKTSLNEFSETIEERP